LPGKPDLVFTKYRLVVFCDGDFWHGRNLERRLSKLSGGHNADYWTKKLLSNVARDAKNNLELRMLGWRIVRLWEKDILRDPEAAAQLVIDSLDDVPRLHFSQTFST
jgi:DNA mismatch endonuclease (patch repair protein)